MSDGTKAMIVPTTKAAAPRTRVALRRVNSNLSKPYPPNGQEKLWWERLKTALGTTSSDFVNATLAQIQNASRLPSGGISEIGVNAVLAFIEGAEPKNEVEAALAIQMACTHAVTMARGWLRRRSEHGHEGHSGGAVVQSLCRTGGGAATPEARQLAVRPGGACAHKRGSKCRDRQRHPVMMN
jgi:hypothetical protein